MTNFERIKAMSIDELAEVLNDTISVFSCDDCSNKNNACTSENCLPFIKEWLEREVE